MASDRDNPGSGPDLYEGLRGAAHLADLASRTLTGDDPQYRNQIDVAGDVTLGELLSAAPLAGRDSLEEPHYEIQDWDGGIEIVVDVTDTQVNDSSLQTVLEEDHLLVIDPETKWNARVETEDPVDDVVAETRGNGIYTARVALEGDEYDVVDEDVEVRDDEPEADATPDRETLSDRLQEGADEDLTFAEAVEENPWFEDLLVDLLGETQAQMALQMYGDRPVDEVSSLADGMVGGGTDLDVDDEDNLDHFSGDDPLADNDETDDTGDFDL